MKLKLIIISFALLSIFNLEATEKVVILGGGPAGLSSAIITGQAGLEPLVIEGPSCTGQLEIIHLIDNYPGFPEEITGAELLNRFRTQADRFGARFDKTRTLVTVDLEQRPFQLAFSDGTIIDTESLIVAQGVTKRTLGLESEELLRGKGVMGTSICKRSAYAGKDVAVVGGGHAALQEALTIAEFANQVFLVNRGDKFAASIYHQELAFANKKIQVLYNTEVQEILDVSQDKVTGIQLISNLTHEECLIPIEGVVIAIGSIPNTELFKGKLDFTPTGHLVMPYKSTETSVQGVFAAGDASELAYGRVITAAGTGSMAALDAIKFLSHQAK